MTAAVHTTIDAGVGTLVLDNPPLNIMTAAGQEGLLAALAECRTAAIRAVIVTGGGDRAFCAGADLREEQALAGAAATRAFLERDEALFAALEAYPGAVLAAVNGHAYGGGFELALACDIRLAAESARLAGVGVTLGLSVSTARFGRLVGETVAKDLLLTGRTVRAPEALALGLVSKVVPDGELLSEAHAWARLVAERAPLSVQANKDTMARCAGQPLAAQVAYEREHFARLQGSRDHKEALHAFFEKRPPRFVGA